MSQRSVSGIGIFICGLILVAGVVIGFTKRAPTPDQLYGCTIEQQAPSGECK